MSKSDALEIIKDAIVLLGKPKKLSVRTRADISEALADVARWLDGETSVSD